jgi:hypothetical protein
MHLAREAGVPLQAEFIPNNRNRMMFITYKFSGFQEVAKRGEVVVLANNLEHLQAFPSYVTVHIEKTVNV